MLIRVFNPETDSDDLKRIWADCGWFDQGLEYGLKLGVGSHCHVVELAGRVEALATVAEGDMRYLNELLPLSLVAMVNTSLVARRTGAALRVTAHGVAEAAQRGSAVAVLGIFDQGFYDKLGFGTGPIDTFYNFDPTALKVAPLTRAARRLTLDNVESIHGLRMTRARVHGGVSIHPTAFTRVALEAYSNVMVIGFDNPDGSLGPHVAFKTRSVDQGPYTVMWYAYQTGQELLELLSLVRTLGDQVLLIKTIEPAHLQLQDLLDRPLRRGQLTDGSKFENATKAFAWWQFRMLDLPSCMAAVRTPQPVRFNLRLTDPIERYLAEETEWRGLSGDYSVVLGSENSVSNGLQDDLPTLNASVGAFSRLWLGVRSASSLALTDTLTGPAQLLTELDRTFALPTPRSDWDF